MTNHGLDALKEVLAQARNQARARAILGAHHGVGLARSRLAIRKDSRVVARKRVLQHLWQERGGDKKVETTGSCRLEVVVGDIHFCR